MESKHVLIAGCGDVGCELARQLLAKNGRFAVWGLRRSVEKLPDGVHPIPADLCHFAELGKWPEKIDFMVYCAAAGGRWDEENHHNIYVKGLSNVLSRMKQDSFKPQRVFFTSSTGVYHKGQGDPGQGEEIDETSEASPGSFSGKIMLEAESLLLNSSFPATVVRFGGIYGPGRNRLLDQVRAGKGCPAEPVIYGNRIHRDDCAGILAHLIERDIEGSPMDDVYLGVDSCPSPMHDVLHWLADQLNVTLDDDQPPPQRPNKRCTNHRIISSGYSMKYPNFKAGYAAVLRGYAESREAR